MRVVRQAAEDGAQHLGVLVGTGVGGDSALGAAVRSVAMFKRVEVDVQKRTLFKAIWYHKKDAPGDTYADEAYIVADSLVDAAEEAHSLAPSRRASDPEPDCVTRWGATVVVGWGH